MMCRDLITVATMGSKPGSQSLLRVSAITLFYPTFKAAKCSINLNPCEAIPAIDSNSESSF